MQTMKDPVTGDKNLREMVLSYTDEIFSAAIRMTKSRGAAENLAAQTFIKAWKIFQGIDGEINIRIWLYRILIDENKQHRAQVLRGLQENQLPTKLQNEFSIYNHLDKELNAATLLGTVVQKISEEDILQALESLPNNFRETVVLADFQNLSSKEISVSLSITLEAVQAQLSTARHFFQKALWDNVGLGSFS